MKLLPFVNRKLSTWNRDMSDSSRAYGGLRSLTINIGSRPGWSVLCPIIYKLAYPQSKYFHFIIMSHENIQSVKKQKHFQSNLLAKGLYFQLIFEDSLNA